MRMLIPLLMLTLGGCKKAPDPAVDVNLKRVITTSATCVPDNDTCDVSLNFDVPDGLKHACYHITGRDQSQEQVFMVEVWAPDDDTSIAQSMKKGQHAGFCMRHKTEEPKVALRVQLTGKHTGVSYVWVERQVE